MGWANVYRGSLCGRWIDVKDAFAGEQVVVDPDGPLQESKSDNATGVKVRIR